MRGSPTKSRRKRTRINGCVFPGRATSCSTHGYALVLSGNTWFLYRNLNDVIDTAASSTGTWNFTIVNEFTLTIIDDPSEPFTEGATLFFNVLSLPNLINELECD